ncbi:uncharacterized protein LOC118192681 [Stegodyphus dumicola]|uniref:uncharacterized protein LOC118192681 n=1 Tax=Stegodyphus dumicola TaxID=202533 RepID=UPI0015AB0148|nr:uncharacterized protein LOC118192681 [Stegodyphus dumicola]
MSKTPQSLSSLSENSAVVVVKDVLDRLVIVVDSLLNNTSEGVVGKTQSDSCLSNAVQNVEENIAEQDDIEMQTSEYWDAMDAIEFEDNAIINNNHEDDRIGAQLTSQPDVIDDLENEDVPMVIDETEFDMIRFSDERVPDDEGFEAPLVSSDDFEEGEELVNIDDMDFIERVLLYFRDTDVLLGNQHGSGDHPPQLDE